MRLLYIPIYNDDMGKTYGIWLNEEEAKLLKKKADDVGLSFSDFVKQCIRFGEPFVVNRLKLPNITNVTYKNDESHIEP